MKDEDPQIERIESKSKPRKCPKCGHAPVEIFLGYASYGFQTPRVSGCR